jgi:hypothetical protein
VVLAILQMSAELQKAIKSIKAPAPRQSPAPRQAAPDPEDEIDPAELFPFITDVLQGWNDDRRSLLKREA